jgi:CO/xanthine dehydrogenase FAD-binding subunit
MKVNEYYRASSLEDAYQKLQEDPRNAILAGGLWIKKMGQAQNVLVDLSTLGLNKISENEKEVIIGSMVTQRDFENSNIVRSLFNDAIGFAVREIMGVNFRNIATIGGSIMGRYPFSDVICGLLPYDVTLELYPSQEMSLEDYLNYKGKLNAILVAIHIKKGKGCGYFKKVKTTALDFPIVNFAVAKFNGQYRIAIGSRPMVASLAHKAMDYLNSIKEPTRNDFEKAALIASEELSFLDNKDASKEYRLDLTKVYVRRGLEEVSK